MVEGKKENDLIIGYVMAIGITLAIIILGVAAFDLLTSSRFDDAKNKALAEIENKDVSDDYRQGWIDGINRLSAWYHAGTNVTASDLRFKGYAARDKGIRR